MVFIGRHDHRLVAGNIGLAGEHVHALCPGSAGRGLQRKTGQASAGQALQAFCIEGVKHAHQRRPGLYQAQLCDRRASYLEHQIAAQCTRGIGDLHPKSGISRIYCAGCYARARLQGNRVPLGN